jgi:hypothetical protein
MFMASNNVFSFYVLSYSHICTSQGRGVSRNANFKEALRAMLLDDDLEGGVGRGMGGGRVGVDGKKRPMLTASTSTPVF